MRDPQIHEHVGYHGAGAHDLVETIRPCSIPDILNVDGAIVDGLYEEHLADVDEEGAHLLRCPVDVLHLGPGLHLAKRCEHTFVVGSEAPIDVNVGKEEVEIDQETLDNEEAQVEVGKAGRVPNDQDEADDREEDEFDNELQMWN
jgi:hypothetical protein